MMRTMSRTNSLPKPGGPRRVRLAAWLLLSLSTTLACRSQTPPPPPAALPPPTPPPRPPFRPSNLPRIDLHTHVMLGSTLRAARLFERFGIVHAVNLSGPPADNGLEDAVADGEVAYKRFTIFTNLDWSLAEKPGYGPKLAASLVRAKEQGAKGVKIPKGLGLGFKGPDGALLKVDDPGLDPMFEKAGELGLPIAIHIGDPQAFWQDPGPTNERYEELKAHPEWSFYAEHKAGTLPSWQALFDAFARRVARHKKTTFIGVHFGNAPEDPDLVARLLDENPNLLIDTAARLPAIGRSDERHSAAKLRAFFIKYQDRILFGTDTGIGRSEKALMFGSTGTAPPTDADAERFYTSTWRYFETADTDIPSPTPIQGRWELSGINLPREVLEKIYAKNAQRLLGIELATQPLPPLELRTHPGPLEEL